MSHSPASPAVPSRRSGVWSLVLSLIPAVSSIPGLAVWAFAEIAMPPTDVLNSTSFVLMAAAALLLLAGGTALFCVPAAVALAVRVLKNGLSARGAAIAALVISGLGVLVFLVIFVVALVIGFI